MWFYQQLLDDIVEREGRLRELARTRQGTLDSVVQHDVTQPADVLVQLARFRDSAIARQQEITQAMTIKRGYECEVADLQQHINDAQQRLDDSAVTSAGVERLREQLSEHSVCTIKAFSHSFKSCI